VAVEVRVEGAEEEATVVAAKVHCRHPLLDAEDVLDGAARAAQRCHLLRLPLPPSMLEPKLVDGFEFGITLNYDGDPDSIRLPRKFGDVVNMSKNQVLLRVCGGATGLWTAEVLFDHTGISYLTSGWRRFCQRHEIVAGHFLVFNCDDDHQITVTVFDETMCCRHYVAPTHYNATVSSSSEDNE
jgi:hypothetical protein